MKGHKRIIEIEDRIARAFGVKYRMIPRRIDGIPNFIFHNSEDGLHPGDYRGAAIVRRQPGTRINVSIPLADITKLLDKDEKGIVLIGLDDSIVFTTPSRAGLNIEGDKAVFTKFTVVSERKGLYA